MCVYLAPRWRRRSLRLILTILLVVGLPTAVDGRALRRLKIGAEAADGSPEKVGVVTTDTQQSTTMVVSRAEDAESGSWLSEKKSVSFHNLVKTNGMPCSKDQSTMPMDSRPLISDRSNLKGHAETKPTDEHAKLGLGGNKVKHQGIRTNAMHHNQSSHDPAMRFDKPRSSVVPGPAAPRSTRAPTADKFIVEPPLSFNALVNTSQSSDFSESKDESNSMTHFGSTKSAEALDSHDKSALLTKETRSLDQSIVGVIIVLVGTIAALLVFASRQVLKEMSDDNEDSLF